MWKVCQARTVRTVPHAIEADWLNDRDQFLSPNEDWAVDSSFQSDCVAFALFHGQNRITSHVAENHWIPFTEKEVDAQGLFKSHFMSDFLAGKVENREVVQADFFNEATAEKNPIVFSEEARAVMDAGRELWRYYHAQPNANPNASFYDIRLHFQGSAIDSKGKARMNNESSDEKYSYVYPTVAEGAFALTNHVQAAVLAASKGEGMFYPLSVGKDGSGTIRYEWKSGGREVEFVIRCFVNSFRQMAVAYYIHTKGDGFHCELSPPKEK